MSSFLSSKFDATSLGIGSLSKAKLADDYHRALINTESQIGASMLSVPHGVGRQEFFLSDSHPNEWFYHAESQMNPDKSTTIRYVVLANDGIYKSIDGGQYSRLEAAELSNFLKLAKAYTARVLNGPYKNVSHSDFSLAA